MLTPLLDLLLAVTCASAAAWLIRQVDPLRRYGALGMGLMAIAAGLGTLRYAGVGGLEPLHRGASHLAGAIAPASFALVAWVIGTGAKRWVIEVGIGALLAGWALFVVLLRMELYRTAIGGAAVIAMLALFLRLRSVPAAILALGGLGIAFAGLAIGTEGSLGPVAAIDVFHVVLATAHLLVATALVRIRSGTTDAST